MEKLNTINSNNINKSYNNNNYNNKEPEPPANSNEFPTKWESVEMVMSDQLLKERTTYDQKKLNAEARKFFANYAPVWKHKNGKPLKDWKKTALRWLADDIDKVR